MAYTFYFESKYRTWGQSVIYLKFELPDGTEFILSDEWIVPQRNNRITIGLQRLIFLKRNNYDNSYHVTVEVSSASNKTSGKIVLERETKPVRMSIIIYLSDFQKLCYPVRENVSIEEINERLVQDTFKYKVTVIRLEESQRRTEIISKKDKILIVSDQLNSLLNSGDFSDTIITDDMGRCAIKAHRNILVARSVYFRCMFRNNWRENKENRVVFREKEDIEMRAIKEMIHYIYTGVLRLMKISDMLFLYMMSDQFLQDDLKKFLSEELRKRLNAENAVIIYIFAGYVLDANLKSSSLDVIRESSHRIHNTQFWTTLRNKENSDILDYDEITNRISEIISRRDD